VTGTLWGIGVGPGDPELVTVKALRILRAAPVVAYLAPEAGRSFARGIVASELNPGKVEIAIPVPMERARHPAQAVYDAAAAEIAVHLKAGRDVALLCQGDPFFYGSFIQIFERLGATYPTRIVPGITSLTACAAAARLPLASRETALTAIPATLPEPLLEQHLRQAEAAAILKLGRNFAKARQVLERLGRAEHAIYVEHASLASERVLSLAEVDPAEVPYFSMILVPAAEETRR